MRKLYIHMLLITLMLIQSCDVQYDDNSSQHQVISREALIMKRADQMGRIIWFTQNDMPAQAAHIPAGTLMTGIPYSSVKEVGGYVGFDLSFYTFLSAVANCRSVLYTEDLSKKPYHGSNATTYYGTVCSSTLSYALGFDLPYNTASIPDLPYVSKLEYQCIDSLKIGDILWRKGHVMMVYDMHYLADGELTDISILESSSGTSISTYSYKKLYNRLSDEGMVAYRSSHDVIDIAFDFDNVTDSRMLHYSLCPNKGDKSVYSNSNSVIINILDSAFTCMTVKKDGQYFFVTPVDDEDITLSDLDEGLYEAFLTGKNVVSSSVSFEVLNTELKYDDLGNNYRIFFNNERGYPEYIFYVTYSGALKYHFKVTEDDLHNGYIDIPKKNESSLYLRFVIRGSYGRAYSSFFRL